MHQFFDLVRISAIGLSAAALVTGPAHALLILPTFDSSLTTQSNAAALESAIDTAVATIDGLYSNPGTVQVLFDYNGAVLGQSQDGENFVTMSQYVSQLTTDSAAHPSNTVLSTALANISKGNGATATYVLGTTAFLRVGLGFTGPGVTPCYNAGGTYVGGCGQTYDAVITIGGVSTATGGAGQNSQAVSVVEHEVDEVLGGGGTVATLMGGRLINQSTTDPNERKLLNVVEEMSIASGVPMPQVYVLNDERAINAFAAGHTPGDAAIRFDPLLRYPDRSKVS